MVYKDLEKKIYPLFRPKIYIPPAQLQQTVNTQPGIMYAQATKTSYTPTQIDDVQYINKPQHELKNMMKCIFE
jgi:hypothetical protein